MSLLLSHTTKVVRGIISLPSSKSISNRALIMRAISGKTITIENLSTAKDTQILAELLANSNRTIFDVGHAGTAMRFLTAYLATKEGEFVLTGSNRMQQRPIKILVDALRNLGAEISYLKNEGYPPLKIKGKSLLGGEISIDGSVSSQYISALMMIAPSMKNGLKINFEGSITSKPYMDMTAEMMKVFGEGFIVEADWSAASYWYSMVALAKDAEITLLGLKKDSLQGDAVVAKIYEKFGVKTEYLENGIRLTKIAPAIIHHLPLLVDFTNCPDLAQTVAVTCVALSCAAKLTGLSTLRIKETDRIAALQNELSKLGYTVEVEGNDVVVLCRDGKSQNSYNWNKISIDTYDDHRMAMAFAPLALLYPITIENPDVVIKSYPNFWEDLRGVGFSVF